MKASLDTNVIIHLYQAGQEGLLFDFFEDGVLIYEQIRNVELEHHGKGILGRFDEDVMAGKIVVYQDEKLKELGVWKLFQGRVKENKNLYHPNDLGEVYAISLAQTLGVYSLVTDDIKQGGPYMSLLQFWDNDIMPFTFADLLILRFLAGAMDGTSVVQIFHRINLCSGLKWSFESHLKRFIKRFWLEPYQKTEEKWIQGYCEGYGIRASAKIKELRDAIRSLDRQP